MATDSKQPKILIVTPTANHKDYCLKDWAKSINELTYDNMDMLIIDNSLDPNHVKEFDKYKFRKNTFITHIPRKETDIDLRHHMARCNEISRVFALKNGYDYIISIESDIFAPCKDAVEKLLAHNKEVVGFNYFVGQYHKSIPLVFQRVSNNTYFINDVKSSHMSGFFLHDGKLKEVPNLGLGFILIKRSVFQEFEFKIDDNEWHINDADKSHYDTHFHYELQKRGIISWCIQSIFQFIKMVVGRN